MREDLMRLVRALEKAKAQGTNRNPNLVYPGDIANRILNILVNHPEDHP